MIELELPIKVRPVKIFHGNLCYMHYKHLELTGFCHRRSLYNQQGGPAQVNGSGQAAGRQHEGQAPWEFRDEGEAYPSG